MWSFSFLQLASTLLVYCIIDANSDDRACSLGDIDRLRKFNFPVPTNPDRNKIQTKAVVDARRNVVKIHIVDESCIPPILRCFKHLKTLEIRNSSFCDSRQQQLFDVRYVPASLISLKIEHVKLIHLSNTIGELRNLTTLELLNVSIYSLPRAIANLSKLRFLAISHSNLRSLFTSAIHLPSIHQITLTDNSHLRSIQSLNGHSNLRILELRRCPVDRLPRNLSHLIQLEISHGNLSDLVGIDTLGTKNPFGKNFHFDGNHINEIPASIAGVRNLVHLNLNSNNLTDLPTNIYEMKTLIDLFLWSNHFTPSRQENIKKKFETTNPNLTVYF